MYLLEFDCRIHFHSRLLALGHLVVSRPSCLPPQKLLEPSEGHANQFYGIFHVCDHAVAKLAIAIGHACKFLVICIIQTFRNALSLTYLDAGLLAPSCHWQTHHWLASPLYAILKYSICGIVGFYLVRYIPKKNNPPLYRRAQ